MNYFYAFMLYATQFELALAKKAPVRNPNYIEALKADEMKWDKELKLWEVNCGRT
jgi:hypothetical protein